MNNIEDSSKCRGCTNAGMFKPAITNPDATLSNTVSINATAVLSKAGCDKARQKTSEQTAANAMPIILCMLKMLSSLAVQSCRCW